MKDSNLLRPSKNEQNPFPMRFPQIRPIVQNTIQGNEEKSDADRSSFWCANVRVARAWCDRAELTAGFGAHTPLLRLWGRVLMTISAAAVRIH